jgi:hypothetical protein
VVPRVRPRIGPPPNLVQHRRIERGRGLPLMARLLLGLSVALLGAVILWASTGQLGKVVAGFGQSLAGIISRVSEASPSPSASLAPLPPPPILIGASEQYTNQASVDIQGTLPTEAAGQSQYKIRLYRSLGDESSPPERVRELAVGATAQFTITAVTLEKGVDFFTATLKTPSGETDPSPSIRFVFDTSKPRITLTSPQDGDTINARTVTLRGEVQSRSVIVARNEANGASVTGKAGPDGTFALTLALEPGVNGLTLSSTDPAGNVSDLVISVLRGSGKLTASLNASSVQFKTSNLPAPVTLTATVTDPDGHPVDGATVTFTLSIPGVDPITQEGATDAAGTAIFQTNVPDGASVGTGLATILVDTQKFGSITARAPIAVVD